MACWLFNEGGGDKVYDLSGYGNHGTLTGMAFPSTTSSGWNPGRDGPALAFDESNDNVNCQNPVSLQITGDLTVSAWINIDDSPPNTYGYQIVAKDKDSGGRAYTFDYYRWDAVGGERLRFYINGGAGSNIIEGSTRPLTFGIWYHAVGVYNTAGTLDLYLNGISDATQVSGADTSIPSATANVLIGAREYAGYLDYFDGFISDVRIWNRSLTAKEVLELYENPYGMFEWPDIWVWAAGAVGLSIPVAMHSYRLRRAA